MTNPYKTLIANALSFSIMPKEFIALLINDVAFRKVLYTYFSKNPNRIFALKILSTLSKFRKGKHISISAELINMACYFVGMHHQIIDSLAIWEAKNIDFDTFIGIDIQLIAFSGVEETLEFLQSQNTEMAQKAYNYTLLASNAGDFDNLNHYFSNVNLPWYI